MRHASLFSGIGGPEVAAAMLGWENVFHCEINPFGRAVLEYWFPESKSYEDITKTNFSEWRGKVDVLTGGFPCQPFSYAGKRGGRNDDRYLWPEMLRVIDEIRPAWVVGENVAGITTMVEGGVLTPLGCDPALFGEGDGLRRYELRETFTIERICRDLESLGYSVQPVLIPAAAVGAPHRRDRVFILANVADTDRRDDVRAAGGNEGEGEGEGIQERHPIRKPGLAGQLRPTVQGAAENSVRDGLRVGKYEEQGRERDERDSCAGNSQRLRLEARVSADADVQRRNKQDSAEEPGEEERQHRAPHIDWRDGRLHPQARWASFPTVSAIHAGDDGLPIRMDRASIPFSEWESEALKAYGNAIVPQVMYEIFRAIEQV